MSSASTNSIRVVALSTIVSRITGLVRDMLVYAIFGTSALNSAFIIAFTIPNLFRRFMGEGALTSALVPILAQQQADDGKEKAFVLFNKVLTRAAIALVITIILGIIAFQLVRFFNLSERWTLAARLGPWVFPYLFFICLSALIGAVLNLQKRFASTAIAQIWVNLTMTLTLGGIGLWVSNDPYIRMVWLCVGVLLGGILQLVLPAHALTKEGWRPTPDLKPDDKLNEIWRLLGPGLLGATVAQIDIVISQFLAFGLDDAAVSVLFLSNRLVQLPLGVFAIAVTTVTFPIIARRAAEGDRPGFVESYRHSTTLIQALMIPAGVGLAILAEPALVALFKWGSFDAQSVRATAPILMTYALAIPFYAGTTLTTRALHSLKDTRTPVRWGVITLLTNLALSISLRETLRPYGLGTWGLAFSNVLSTALFAYGLRWELKRKVAETAQAHAPLLRLGLCAGLMALAVIPIVFLLPETKLGRLVTLGIGAPLGLVVYTAGLYLFSRDTFRSLKELIYK